MSRPRLLAIMGSGETAPTMVSVHAELFRRLGEPAPRAVLLDTPFGFQENADDIVRRTQQYFRDNVRQEIGVASFRSRDQAGDVGEATAIARLREADYIFCGPGSPTYTLRQLRGSDVFRVLADKLHEGGCICVASAAAVTLGRLAVPVYEIYKCGEAPYWEKGLDLLSHIGVHGALIPHFNNAEGAPTTRASATWENAGCGCWKGRWRPVISCWASTNTPHWSATSTPEPPRCGATAWSPSAEAPNSDGSNRGAQCH